MRLRAWACLVVVLGFSQLVLAADKAEEAGTKTAEAWLALVDGGKFGESWDASSKRFQAAITRDKWSDALTTVRTPLGAMVSRRLRSAEYRTSLPGVPDGEYVVVQFDTSFQNKKQAVETVTPMLEADGTWRVTGYFIK